MTRLVVSHSVTLSDSGSSLTPAVITIVGTGAVVAATCVTVLVLIVKMAARWATMEERQAALIQRVDRLVTDEIEIHRAMMGAITSLSNRLWELHKLIRQK